MFLIVAVIVTCRPITDANYRSALIKSYGCVLGRVEVSFLDVYIFHGTG